MRPGRRDALILAGVGLAAAAAGIVLGPRLLSSRDGASGLLAASFTDLSGKERRIVEWQGRVLVCNFWATWCAPCREEIPLLISTREKFSANGVEVVGIAIDTPAKVREFMDSIPIPYPVLLAGGDALDVMRSLGNATGGLPYTVILGRDGRVAHRRLGLLREPELESALERLLR